MSRSFYLTVRVLPRAVRVPIEVAYLLARTSDTIVDTELVAVEERLAALDQFRARALGGASTRLDLTRLTMANEAEYSPAERRLLDRAEETLQALEALPPTDQQRIREVLATITGGQEQDLRRFGGAVQTIPAVASDMFVPVVVRALETDAELEDYTYRVAGCVGEFWTRLCRAHLFPKAAADEEFLLRAGKRFGQGLQLVNVLRDLPRDLGQGRCYLPAARLRTLGLAPADLIDPAVLGRFRPLLDEYLNRAESWLAEGWAYTNALPRNQARLRLACAWPILIGLKTLGRLRSGPVLSASPPIKITRAEVRAIVVRSVLYHPFPWAWQRLFQWAKG